MICAEVHLNLRKSRPEHSTTVEIEVTAIYSVQCT